MEGAPRAPAQLLPPCVLLNVAVVDLDYIYINVLLIVAVGDLDYNYINVLLIVAVVGLVYNYINVLLIVAVVKFLSRALTCSVHLSSL